MASCSSVCIPSTVTGCWCNTLSDPKFLPLWISVALQNAGQESFCSMAEHHWFVNWEDSNKKHLSLILFCFDLVVVLTDLSWEATKQQFWLLPVSFPVAEHSCILCFIHTRHWLWFVVLSLHLFFLHPNEPVLLVCFLNHITVYWEYPGTQLLACPGGVNLVCLSGRVRDSSRGQFSAGSQLQPVSPAGGSSAFPLCVYRTWEIRKKAH